jgi:hypothetical protein
MSFLFAGAVGSSPNKIGNREYSQMLRELALPKPEGDKYNFAITRAAKACGLEYWRAFDIWYRKARRIDDHEAIQIREALRLKREKALADEYHELKVRIAKLESALLVQANPHVDRNRHALDGQTLRGAR